MMDAFLTGFFLVFGVLAALSVIAIVAAIGLVIWYLNEQRRDKWS